MSSQWPLHAIRAGQRGANTFLPFLLRPLRERHLRVRARGCGGDGVKTPPDMFRWDALRRNLKTLTPLDHEATREEQRLLHTVLDPHGWDETVAARGLAGLKLSAAGEWDLGWMFVFRLGHRLDFAAVKDRAGHLAVAMGLLRPQVMATDYGVLVGHDAE